MSTPIEPESNPTVAHEKTDANPRAITRFGIVLTLGVIVVQLLLWWLFDHFSAREARLSPPVPSLVQQQAPREPPEPRLQGNPPLDMRNMQEEEDAILNHYGWVDPDKGVVRIPVDRAIEIAASRGLPQFQGTGSGPGAKNPGDTAPGKAFGLKRQTPR